MIVAQERANQQLIEKRTDMRDVQREETPYPVQLATYVGAFFDELERGGVKDVVISPGSRSTPLSLMAHASSLDVYVDVDERGAAFFALGLAKATGRAVALICTSGTAVANYYPAVLEAETSRVPLLVLSGDRPARLQQLGAPQTCDQLKIFGDHVRKFWNMPEPSSAPDQVRYVRQIAREALAALEPHTLTSAPVHINFPFDEPLLPEGVDEAAFKAQRSAAHAELPCLIEGHELLDAAALQQIEALLLQKRAIAVCGEGTLGVFDASDPACWDLQAERARILCEFAHHFDLPLLADPLSQLRSFTDEAIIDNYDNIFGRDEIPDFEVVIRFGRYPVSKRLYKALETKPHLQIVVDPLDTRDFNSATTTLVKTTPLDFVSGLITGARKLVDPRESAIAAWARANDKERELLTSVEAASFVTTCTREGCTTEEIALEGAYVQALLDQIPDRSLLFSANSMAIRALDTFYVKHSAPDEGVVMLGAGRSDGESGAPEKRITVLANRGLNGIDGTLSSAFGAAQAYDQTYFLTGDLTLLHDLNAFALSHEFAIRANQGKRVPSIIVILFNNGGGGIFDLLPQKSSDPYFERLFLTPQAINFEKAAQTFGVLYKKADGLDDFRNTLKSWNGTQGVHLLEVDFPIDSLAGRYRQFQ